MTYKLIRSVKKEIINKYMHIQILQVITIRKHKTIKIQAMIQDEKSNNINNEETG